MDTSLTVGTAARTATTFEHDVARPKDMERNEHPGRAMKGKSLEYWSELSTSRCLSDGRVRWSKSDKSLGRLKRSQWRYVSCVHGRVINVSIERLKSRQLNVTSRKAGASEKAVIGIELSSIWLSSISIFNARRRGMRPRMSSIGNEIGTIVRKERVRHYVEYGANLGGDFRRYSENRIHNGFEGVDDWFARQSEVPELRMKLRHFCIDGEGALEMEETVSVDSPWPERMRKKISGEQKAPPPELGPTRDIH
ncbi:hypothetical protein B0H13DRAFT_2272830 [Mycena leptocephala]|nr:hypothetical protein B0H13DRAFT_2272830 [Mycena leptocephala]